MHLREHAVTWLLTCAEDMKGFSGSDTCGVRVTSAHVKGRFDVMTLGFASERDKAMFVNTVSQSLQPEVRPSLHHRSQQQPAEGMVSCHFSKQQR